MTMAFTEDSMIAEWEGTGSNVMQMVKGWGCIGKPCEEHSPEAARMRVDFMMD